MSKIQPVHVTLTSLAVYITPVNIRLNILAVIVAV